MSQHALASPSSAETWMRCPGSLAMQKGLADTANDYSDHGTAAHLLGSTCLETGKVPEDLRGETIHVGSLDGFDGAVWFDSAERHDPRWVERRKYTVDEEMIEGIGRYVARVRQYAEGADLLMPERRVSIEHITGEKDAHGTADAAVVMRRELQLHDLKWGMGVRVSPAKNKQLMMYADATREDLEMTYGPFDRIRLVIHQPRLNENPEEWDCAPAELATFIAEASAKARAALKLHDVSRNRFEGLEEHLVASEDACRWCKAKATCPELARFVIDKAGADFEAISAPGIIPPLFTPVSDADLLSQKMAAIPLIEDWCKAVRAEVERRVFAGEPVPGWKVVQGKRGNRAWSDLPAAEALLKKMRLPIEERYDMKLKSPPAIEKLLKPEPRRWRRVLDAALISEHDGKPSVAPESDPRPVWTPPDTSNDFTATAEEEMA